MQAGDVPCPDNPDGTTTVVGPCEFDDDVEDDCDD